MLKIECDRCKSELQEPGALVFSPPTTETWLVEKHHLCAKCWSEVAPLLKNQNPKISRPNNH